MKLRRFNNSGIDQFRNFVKKLRADKTLAAPTELLLDEDLTVVIKPEIEVPDTTFTNRLAAAEYLDKVLSPVGLADAFNDVGLWSWLALRFFDQLRPLSPGANLKKLGVDAARFIPTDDYTDRHRHLLRHPLQVYRMVNKDVSQVLCWLVQPVHRPGEVIEQFASRQMFTWYKSEVLATLSALIVDTSTMTIKPRASTKARRLEQVLAQFDCTWDLGYITKDQLVRMLPYEFEEFRR